jgi:hypothetical protein
VLAEHNQANTAQLDDLFTELNARLFPEPRKGQRGEQM